MDIDPNRLGQVFLHVFKFFLFLTDGFRDLGGHLGRLLRRPGGYIGRLLRRLLGHIDGSARHLRGHARRLVNGFMSSGRDTINLFIDIVSGYFLSLIHI